MARAEDIPQPTRDVAVTIPCPSFDTTPFVTGPALSRRKVAIVSSAALIRPGEQPFAPGSAEVRFLPGAERNLLVSHVSINFDRGGFQRDLNTIYPIDRLNELAAEGVIGGVADTHYTVMGSTDPAGMTDAADAMAARMRADGVDSVLLSPV